MKFALKALSIAVLGAASTFTFAEVPASEHSVSGNIGLLSSYNLRGITNVPENSGATIQGGLDYSHASGFYAGYWGSTLDYALGEEGRDSFEHDFYAGYNGKITEDLGYTVGGTYYYYYESDVDSDGFETLLGLNYKDFSVSAQTLTQNTTWGNKGDTYILGSYSYALPKDFTLNTSLGLYAYGDDDEFVETTEDFGFRHFTAGLSHPLGDTGASVNMDYIVGGYDRLDEKQKNKVVFGLKYEF
ncbi:MULTISPECIES: TorF family putative porin [unclassified Acinetobacter]|uniref:TorF family putative porin n=1 Tax=unclassified Acinetobacter TaxID=196816 RepID=UPI0015D2C81A|nr:MULTISPECIES: TorF family putative porin [unclassified Acinetobacter]